MIPGCDERNAFCCSWSLCLSAFWPLLNNQKVVGRATATAPMSLVTDLVY